MSPLGELISILGGCILISGTGGGGFIISKSLSSIIGTSPILSSGVTSLTVVVDTVVTLSRFKRSVIDNGLEVLTGFSVWGTKGLMICGDTVGRSIGKDVTFGLLAMTSLMNGFGVVVAMNTGIGCLVFRLNEVALWKCGRFVMISDLRVVIGLTVVVVGFLRVVL